MSCVEVLRDAKDLIPLHEAARALGRNREALRRAAVEGRLPGARLVLGRWVIHAEDLQRIVRGRARTTQTTGTR